MTLAEVATRLVGRRVVKVEAEGYGEVAEPHRGEWLTGAGGVVITLDDGTTLDTMGQPLDVWLPGPRRGAAP
jgi:hypothetical protein